MKYNVLLVLLFIISFPCFSQPLRVAILDFDNISGIAKYDGLGKAMSSMLISDIESNVSPKRLQLVERAQINKILKEQNFQKTGNVDKNTSIKIGKLLGVKYLLIGDVYILNDVLVLNARLTDAESGDIKFSKKQEGKLTQWLSLKTNIAKDLSKEVSMPFTEPSVQDKEINIGVLTSFGSAISENDNGNYDKAEMLISTLKEIAADFKYLDDLKDELEKLKKQVALQGKKIEVLEKSGGRVVGAKTYDELKINLLNKLTSDIEKIKILKELSTYEKEFYSDLKSNNIELLLKIESLDKQIDFIYANVEKPKSINDSLCNIFLIKCLAENLTKYTNNNKISSDKIFSIKQKIDFVVSKITEKNSIENNILSLFLLSYTIREDDNLVYDFVLEELIKFQISIYQYYNIENLINLKDVPVKLFLCGLRDKTSAYTNDEKENQVTRIKDALKILIFECRKSIEFGNTLNYINCAKNGNYFELVNSYKDFNLPSENEEIDELYWRNSGGNWYIVDECRKIMPLQNEDKKIKNEEKFIINNYLNKQDSLFYENVIVQLISKNISIDSLFNCSYFLLINNGGGKIEYKHNLLRSILINQFFINNQQLINNDNILNASKLNLAHGHLLCSIKYKMNLLDGASKYYMEVPTAFKFNENYGLLNREQMVKSDWNDFIEKGIITRIELLEFNNKFKIIQF
jgi:TolB-like protein